jgi:hypothetical protein
MMYCFYLGLEKVERKQNVKRIRVLYLSFEGHSAITTQFHLSPLLLGRALTLTPTRQLSSLAM